MIRLFITNAAVKAVSLVVRVFMWVSESNCHPSLPVEHSKGRASCGNLQKKVV
jgi:hypothetical protein